MDPMGFNFSSINILSLRIFRNESCSKNECPSGCRNDLIHININVPLRILTPKNWRHFADPKNTPAITRQAQFPPFKGKRNFGVNDFIF